MRMNSTSAVSFFLLKAILISISAMSSKSTKSIVMKFIEFLSAMKRVPGCTKNIKGKLWIYDAHESSLYFHWN